MNDTAQTTAIATVIATVITALAAWATQRSAAAAAEKNQTVASRTEIEQEAFTRAKDYYTDTIDRQDREIHELEQRVVSLNTRVRSLEQDAEAAHEQVTRLREDLRLAHEALRIRFPDE